MRIAIVDDENTVRQMLDDYVQRFAEESGITMETSQFSSGDAFMEDYKMVYDIVIFDIEMPGTNGMDTARRLREIDKNITIIFVTNMAQYAVNGYEVDAVDYILKPVNYYDFSMKFHRTVAKAAQQKEHIITIDTPDGLRRLKISAIKYVEVLGHYLYFHTVKNVYKIRGSMQEISDQLEKYFFVRIHRSFIVNIRYVDKILSKEVTIAGETFLVGRAYKDQLKQEYMKYIRGEE